MRSGEAESTGTAGTERKPAQPQQREGEWCEETGVRKPGSRTTECCGSQARVCFCPCLEMCLCCQSMGPGQLPGCLRQHSLSPYCCPLCAHQLLHKYGTLGASITSCHCHLDLRQPLAPKNWAHQLQSHLPMRKHTLRLSHYVEVGVVAPPRLREREATELGNTGPLTLRSYLRCTVSRWLNTFLVTTM